MTNRHKVALFADRLKRVTESFRADVESIMEDAKKADVDTSGLKRLVSWMGQDHQKRAEREAIDEQYRFLAGEIATPPAAPTEGELAQAIELYRDKATCRQVADSLKVSLGKAQKLRVLALAFIVQAEMNAPETTTKQTDDDKLEYLPHLDRRKAVPA